MVHILIVSHGHLAEALKESSTMFYGDVADNLETCCLLPEDNPEEMKKRIIGKINAIDDGDGVLIFADLFAGTPCNMTALAISELSDRHIECITGVNLPLLMEAMAMMSTSTLQEIVSKVIAQMPNSIVDLKKILGI